jgi:hypothetical protein
MHGDTAALPRLMALHVNAARVPAGFYVGLKSAWFEFSLVQAASRLLFSGL